MDGVASGRAATDEMDATPTANVASARIACRDNPAPKARNAGRAVNAPNAIGPAKDAISAPTRRLKPQHRRWAARSRHSQPKNHASNSSRKPRLRRGRSSPGKKAKDGDAVAVVVVAGVVVARDASRA